MAGFAHLAVRTCYSLRDGVIRPRALAETLAARGMDTVGIADRGGLYGAIRTADACARTGIKLILATDLALAPTPNRPGWNTTHQGRTRPAPTRSAATEPAAPPSRRQGGVAADPEWAKRPYPPRRSRRDAPLNAMPGSGAAWLEDDAARVILIARSQIGYANLCRTVTDHHLESDRSDPHLQWSQLERWAGATGGVVALLGDDSPVGRLLDAGRGDAADGEARRWMDLLGRSAVLIGVTHHLAPGDDARARARFALADRLGLRAVAHQSPRYLDPGEARIADVVEAVRLQVPLDPRHVSRRNSEGWLKDPEAMARVFAERPDAIANAAEVADACRVDLGLGRLRVPDFVALGDRAQSELAQRCEAGVHERYADVGAVHRDLLERELAMVAQLGLAPYFLTVAEIVARIREKGIMAACRGSAAGSILTYALRISDVDPVAHDLVFERFMNPYRDELPDIDIDVESARREDVYRDLIDRYGEDRIACVCMVDTFKARMAIREVGKALGLPAGEVDHVAKSFPHVRAGDVRAAMEHLPEMRGLRLDAGQLGLLFDVVERMDGLPRHIALHPCGVLLGDASLRDTVPLERSAAGFAMAQFDKDDVEALGLCKLDVLAVRMLSSMAHCVEEVARTRGEQIDFDTVPWDDRETYELIRTTRTLGMFQIESPGQRELVGKFQPEHLPDLVVDISLFRPGPVKGDMVGPFLQRRLGTARAVPVHPLLQRALGETYGVIVYHEQVMRAVAAMTGCDLATADLVRRRLGDPTQVERLAAWFLAGARERGMPDGDAAALWHALAQFASFGFCKAHAAAFAVPTYRSAWLKRHYLPEFVAGLLTHDPGMYPRRLLLDDARQFGVCVLPLDVNRSASEYRVERVPADEAYQLLGVRGGSRVAPPGRVGGAPLGVPRGSRVGPPGRVKPLSPLRPDARPPSLPRGWRWAEAEGQDQAGVGVGWELVPSGGLDLGGDGGDGGWRFGVRLGLQDVAGIDARQIESLVVGRPFMSVGDLRRRAALSQPIAEALTHAGALDELGGVEAGVRTRRDLLLEVSERWSGLTRHRVPDPAAPRQLELLEPEPSPGLREYRPSERVRAELEVLGLEVSRHVVSFYDDLLDVLGVTRAVDLLGRRNGERVRVGGVKVATQTPPVKSGQRIVFLSLDDATGVTDSTFFESVHDRCAWTVFHTWLLVVEGAVHRTGARGVSLNAHAAWDLRRLMHAWRGGWLDQALRERRGPSGVPLDDRAGGDFVDGAPSEQTRGAPGRSGLRLDQTGEADHVTLAARLRAPRTSPYGVTRVPSKPAAAPDEPGAPSRTGPNGATWADPADRHPGVESGDVRRLARTDPRHPEHDPDESSTADPPRKLWHASGGSAGR